MNGILVGYLLDGYLASCHQNPHENKIIGKSGEISERNGGLNGRLSPLITRRDGGSTCLKFEPSTGDVKGFDWCMMFGWLISWGYFNTACVEYERRMGMQWNWLHSFNPSSDTFSFSKNGDMVCQIRRIGCTSNWSKPMAFFLGMNSTLNPSYFDAHRRLLIAIGDTDAM